MAVSAKMATQTQTEDEARFLAQVLRLRDAVIAGKHAQIKLPPSAIEQLKASLVLPGQQNGTRNASPFASTATDQRPLLSASDPSTAHGLVTSSSGLDPIFLQKAPSLVRAEGMMKRRRIEHELEVQVEQRKHAARDRDPAHEGHLLNVNAILLDALQRVKPVSGFKPAPRPLSSAASSFDENDYYSSQVESGWSSDASSSKGSDREAGALDADLQYHGKPLRDALYAHSSFPEPSTAAKPAAVQKYYSKAPETVQLDEDDEYTPPDATAFEPSHRLSSTAINIEQPIPLVDDDDDRDGDDDEYEPGEITQGSVAPTPYASVLQAASTMARAPVIRNNHLTHIAAPQPNRVSPLATAKGPSIELELVNGRPEVVRSMQTHHAPRVHSRASTASLVGHGGAPSKKERKKAKQKRKRQSDHDVGRGPSAKKRHERQAGAQSPITPIQTEPYIKPEPISPSPLQQVMEAPAYGQHAVQYRRHDIDLVSPRRMASQPQYASHAPTSSLRREYAPAAPGMARLASPAGYYPTTRDTQNLRRVASLQHAQRVPSPTQPMYSPYRALSNTYGQYQQPTPLYAAAEIDDNSAYQEVQVQYVRTERPRSPPRAQEYQESYQSRGPSPALMPPPPPRRIIVDQFGQRYYAAEPVPEPARASIAPAERRAPSDFVYEPRAPSRAAYAAYEPTDSGLALPPAPLPRRASDRTVEVLDANGHRYREYSSRPVESLRHGEVATPPHYQQVPRHEQMPPPQPPPVRQQTSPVYTPTRTYSVRPEETHPLPPNYVRQASVVSTQYVRHDAPPPPATRATSVLPGVEYGSLSRNYSHTLAPAPHQVTYVDQYGREVYPREVRQASEYRY